LRCTEMGVVPGDPPVDVFKPVCPARYGAQNAHKDRARRSNPLRVDEWWRPDELAAVSRLSLEHDPKKLQSFLIRSYEKTKP